MNNNATPCECPLAGYCERHGVNKSAHLHKLCKNHIGYFQMWEDCKGPNQNPNNCTKNKNPGFITPAQSPISEELKTNDNKLPTTMQMAKNFLSSAANHVRNGMQNVSDEEKQDRLNICNECPHITEDKSRCGKCGCFLQTKTTWASSSCPIGKW